MLDTLNDICADYGLTPVGIRHALDQYKLSSIRRARRALEREADRQLVGKSDTLRNGGKADGEP